MAKFKIGDVVSVKREAAEMIDNPALARKRGRVTKVLPGGYYEVDGELGATGMELTDAELTLANSRACNGVRSRNSVVAKALNACARNGGIDDFEVGDRVMVRSVVGFTPTDPKPGTVTAIYKSDNRIAVKKDDGGRGLFDASMVTKNACGTARNAGAYDVAAQAGNLFKDAYNALAGCAANLEKLTTLGLPNDVPGNNNKIASWAKDKARKVRDLMSKLDQGRL